MRVAAIPAAGQVERPGAELLHPGPGRARAGEGDPGHRPQHVEVVAGVPAVALRSMRGNAHPREELGLLLLAECVEQDRRHAALAVVVVRLDPRVVVTVGDGTLARVEPQQPGTPFDGGSHLGILHPRFPCQHQPDGQYQPGRVHHAIPTQAPVRDGEPVAPGSDRTLPRGGFHREPLQARQHRLVAGRQRVLGEEQHAVAVVPALHPLVCIVGCPLGFSLHKRDVLGVPACQHRERVQRPRNGVHLGVVRLRHPSGERLAPVFEKALGLLTPEGGCRGVVPQHRKRDRHLCRLARPPSSEGESSPAGL